VEEAEAAGAKRHIEIANQLEAALIKADPMDLRPTAGGKPRRERRLDLIRSLVNPWSYSQTIENLFYFSFLIKEGRALVEVAPTGRPVLYAQRSNVGGLSAMDSASQQAMQAVMSLDMAAWRGIVEKEGMKEPLLTHRGNRDQSAAGTMWCKTNPG